MKLKLGDIVRLVILDHCDQDANDPEGPLVFEVFGRIVREAKTSYSLQWWGSEDGVVNGDTDMVCILKSAIIKRKVLK